MTEATKNEILDEITVLLANKGLITSEVEEIWYTISDKFQLSVPQRFSHYATAKALRDQEGSKPTAGLLRCAEAPGSKKYTVPESQPCPSTDDSPCFLSAAQLGLDAGINDEERVKVTQVLSFLEGFQKDIFRAIQWELRLFAMNMTAPNP